MRPVAAERVYYPALDGMRGLAILLVIFHHNFNFIPVSKFGWIGVDLFFVLSGFLITDILLKTKGNKNFLRNFYLRRTLRIFPLYYLVLLLFFILAPYFTELKGQYAFYHNDQFFLWGYLQNWFLIFHTPPSYNNSIFGHFWSLSIEEHFYLLWPFIILFCRNLKTLTHIIISVLIFFIMFRFFSWSLYGNSDLNYKFQYYTRMDGLCIGSLIAIWKFDRKQIKARIMKLAGFFFTIHLLLAIISKSLIKNLPYFNFIGFTSISIFFGIILVCAIEARSKLLRLLFEASPIRYIGKISYGLYIYHIPILILFRLYFSDTVMKLGLSQFYSNIVIAFSAAIATILVSIISFNLFEKKLLLLKEKMTAEGFSLFLRKKIRLWLKPASAK